MDKTLRVLFIEDMDEHTRIMVRQLQKDGFQLDYTRIDTALDLQKALSEKEWDIVISDYSMPGFSGEEALQIFNAAHLDIPFILVSGSVGEDIAVQMMKSGASDYIMKEKISFISPAVKREVTEFANRRKNKLMEAAWLDSEERFRTAFENTPIGINLISLEGKIFQTNKAFCEMLGYNQAEMVSFNFRDITHPEDLLTSNDAIQQLVSGKINTVKHDKRYKRKDDSYVWVGLSASMVRNPQDKPQYIIVQAEDITKKKQLVDEILRAKEKAEESDKLKSALLTNMSHELRTPMNGVLGFSELITKANAPNDVKNMAQLINLSGKRLMQTLDSILLLAQLQSDTREVDLGISRINLSQEMKGLAKAYETPIKDKGLLFEVDIEDNIVTDSEPKLLRQTISRLLDNAIKFTHTGLIKLNLHTEIADNRVCACISVTDTGIGIKEEHLEAIFDEFRQSSEGYDRSYEGIGIGLSIAKRIVDLFKGKITVSSSVGNGSTFTVYLPLEESDSAHEVKATGTSEQFELKPAARNIHRILIVEDNMINTKLLVHFISDFCQMIDCASSGESAVDMARTKVYDAILMDINLGAGMDGLQATQIIRKYPGYKKVPIIAVTGYTMLGDKERLLAGGCSHYVGKPFTQETISDILNQILPLTSEALARTNA